jgi:hypothetical protein
MSANGETGLKRAIIDAVNATGLARVWNSPSGKARGNRIHMAPTGTADIVGYMLRGSCRGFFVGLEVKHPGAKRKPAQEAWAAELTSAGAVYGCVSTVLDAVAIVVSAYRRAVP